MTISPQTGSVLSDNQHRIHPFACCRDVGAVGVAKGASTFVDMGGFLAFAAAASQLWRIVIAVRVAEPGRD